MGLWSVHSRWAEWPLSVLSGFYDFYDFHFRYNMVGKATRTCTAAGWDGQVPTCESKFGILNFIEWLPCFYFLYLLIDPNERK